MKKGWLGLVLCALVYSDGACSDNSSVADSGSPDVAVDDVSEASDAGADVDFGAPSDAYPAFQPTVPQILNTLNNPALSDFTVVPVVYSSDTGAANVGDFLTKLAASQALVSQGAEYGVGKMTVATTVSLTDVPPSSISDAQIAAWLRDRLDGTHPEFGPTDVTTIGKTVFVLIYPAGTTITKGASTSCTSFQGYHGAAALASDAGVPDGGLSASASPIYAVIARCSIQGLSQEQALTQTIGHEVIESATDPYPLTARAYGNVDIDHIAWNVAMGGDEVADMCAFVNSFWAPPDIGYTIARSWSNVAATALHDPCVQAPPGAYFNTYIPTETVKIFTNSTKGVRVPVGTTRVVDVNFYSDGPTSGPWTINATEVQTQSNPLALTLSLDRNTGTNGEKAHLTITANTSGPSQRSIIRMNSKLGNRESLWFTWVALQ